MTATTKPRKRRRRQPVENREFAQMMLRLLRAYTRRCADADPYDLADMVAVNRELEAAIHRAVLGMREAQGFSWAEIAEPLGITRQAAFQRWGRPVPVAVEGASA